MPHLRRPQLRRFVLPDSGQYLAKRLQKRKDEKRRTERRKHAAANTRPSSITVTAKAKEAKVVVTEAAEAAVVLARRFGDEAVGAKAAEAALVARILWVE